MKSACECGVVAVVWDDPALICGRSWLVCHCRFTAARKRNLHQVNHDKWIKRGENRKIRSNGCSNYWSVVDIDGLDCILGIRGHSAAVDRAFEYTRVRSEVEDLSAIRTCAT